MRDFLVIIGIICVLTYLFSYLGYAMMQISAERLSFRLRARYLRSLMKQEVAFFAAVTRPPAGPEMTVDIGQDIRRVHVATSRSASDAAAVQCFCERSEPWLVRASRYLTGCERLAIHGITLREVTNVENDGFLAALAGNSFSAPVFISAFVAGCQG